MVELAPIQRILLQSEYHLKVWFAAPAAPPFPAGQFPEASVVETHGNHLHLLCHGSPDPLIKWLAQFPIERLATPEPTLEEAFMDYYSADGDGAEARK